MNTRLGYYSQFCNCSCHKKNRFSVGDRFVRKYELSRPELATIVEVLKTDEGYYYKLDKFNVVYSESMLLNTDEFLPVIE